MASDGRSRAMARAVTFCAMRRTDITARLRGAIRGPGLLCALGALALIACGPRVVEVPSPVPGAPLGRLPEVPLVEGPLAIRVQYPDSGASIGAVDSNFIHGTVQNGRAALTINGASVTVQPNGAFIAYLPAPSMESPRYELTASVGADTVRLTHHVR